jgi:hypothetical protein
MGLLGLPSFASRNAVSHQVLKMWHLIVCSLIPWFTIKSLRKMTLCTYEYTFWINVFCDRSKNFCFVWYEQHRGWRVNVTENKVRKVWPFSSCLALSSYPTCRTARWRVDSCCLPASSHRWCWRTQSQDRQRQTRKDQAGPLCTCRRLSRPIGS